LSDCDNEPARSAGRTIHPALQVPEYPGLPKLLRQGSLFLHHDPEDTGFVSGGFWRVGAAFMLKNEFINLNFLFL
jgi:hypothetical protein